MVVNHSKPFIPTESLSPVSENVLPVPDPSIVSHAHSSVTYSSANDFELPRSTVTPSKSNITPSKSNITPSKSIEEDIHSPEHTVSLRRSQRTHRPRYRLVEEM